MIALILVFITSSGLLQTARAEERFWFFFTDKGTSSLAKQHEEAAARITPRALARRAKCNPGASAIDMTDMNVNPEYLHALQQLGIKPVVTSRWLNAVSAVASPQQIEKASKLLCIRKIGRVAVYHKALPETALSKPEAGLYSDTDYGGAFIQNEQIQVPALHQMGYQGQGVIIAVFDTGFRLNHEALDSIKVLAQYDFINNDFVTDNQAGDRPSQNSHGTQVLSIIAAEQKGKMIGAAPRAQFLLAKTEDVSQEVRAEEDHWIAAAEWAEGLGADVISTSLGYIDWYQYQDMDGNTAPITQAADMAVKKGVVVVVSAGNEGNDLWHYISAPADGDSVLAVGAVDRNGNLAGFSSHGPTYDGRTKPDIVTMGVGVTAINVPPESGLGTGYTSISGTSAACPLAAGAVALLLCANPDLKPMEIVTALRTTASRTQNPDNDYGWGLVQTLSAFRALAPPLEIPKTFSLAAVFPNPVLNDGTQAMTVQLDMTKESHVSIELYNILGQRVGVLFQGGVLAGKGRLVSINIPAELVKKLGSGTYFIRVHTDQNDAYRPITVLSGFSIPHY